MAFRFRFDELRIFERGRFVMDAAWPGDDQQTVVLAADDGLRLPPAGSDEFKVLLRHTNFAHDHLRGKEWPDVGDADVVCEVSGRHDRLGKRWRHACPPREGLSTGESPLRRAP